MALFTVLLSWCTIFTINLLPLPLEAVFSILAYGSMIIGMKSHVVTKGMVGLIVLVVIVAVSLFLWNWKLTGSFVPTRQVACTLEAKLCLDGSAVGRSGPGCEFAACPGE